MRMHETYDTSEQLAQLEARREEVGEDQIAAIDREWAELSAQMKAHRDLGITESLGRMYREQGPERASRGTFDADLLEYVTRAKMANDGG